MDDVEVKINGTLVETPILSVTVDQRLMVPAHLSLVLGGFDEQEVPQVAFGAEVVLAIIVDTGRTEIFTGTVVSLQGQDDALGRTLTVHAYDALHALTGGTATRVFSKMKTSDIIDKVLQEAGLAKAVDSTSTVHEHVWQHAENDFDFLTRTALSAGLVMWVEGKKVVVKKIPTAASGAARPHNLQAEPAPLEATVGTNVIAWSGRLSASESVASVASRGWDPTKATAVLATVSAGGTMVANGSKPPTSRPKKDLDRVGVAADPGDAKARAAAAAEATVGWQADLSLQLAGTPALRAGTVVSFGKVGKPFDGTYVVTAAVHRLDPAVGYTTDVESTGLSDRSLLGTLTNGVAASGVGGGIARDRPPGPSGVVPAIITNVKDPEKRGRVKVKYPWLADLESDWARLLLATTGVDGGLIVYPAVNDEVMVAFEHGSLDRPLVLGVGRMTKEMKGSIPVEEFWIDRQVWRDKTGQRIELVSKSGAESLIITGPNDEATVTISKADKSIVVKSAQYAVTVDAGGPVSVTSKKDVTLKGLNVTIEANGSLKISSKGQGELSATGPLTVKGAVIKLN